jgi:hypothetical protein
VDPGSNVTASPGPDSIAWDESYQLADFQVEYPHTYTEPSGQTVIDRSEANVSFTSRWTGSVYPGEAKCVVMLLDPAANEVGRLEFGLASSRPIGEHDLAVPFKGDGRPVLASGSCGKGRARPADTSSRTSGSNRGRTHRV